MKITTSIKIDKKVWSLFKAYCVKHDLDLSEGLKKAINKALRENIFDFNCTRKDDRVIEVFWDWNVGEASFKTTPYFEKVKESAISFMDLQTDLNHFAKDLTAEAHEDLGEWSKKIRAKAEKSKEVKKNG